MPPKIKNMGYMNSNSIRAGLENKANILAENVAESNIAITNANTNTDGHFVFSRRTLQLLKKSDDNSKTGSISASATDQDSLAGMTTKNQSLTASTEGNKTFSENPSEKVVANDKDAKIRQQYEDLLKDRNNPNSDIDIKDSDLGGKLDAKCAANKNEISTVDSGSDNSLSAYTTQQ